VEVSETAYWAKVYEAWIKTDPYLSYEVWESSSAKIKIAIWAYIIHKEGVVNKQTNKQKNQQATSVHNSISIMKFCKSANFTDLAGT